VHFPSYSSALSWLYARNQFAMKLGLEGPRALLDALGNPEAGGNFLHVAGTNGKGSVCAALAAMLPVLGKRRVGLYTSPHLVSFRERIRVNGEPIPETFVLEWLNRNFEILKSRNPTYFEIVTALALCWFQEQECDAVVLETGLGGRLDATNVVTPRVTVITSIALDHTAILGDTLEAVLGEKLGIVKPCVPLIFDESRPALAAITAERVRMVSAGCSQPEVLALNLADRFTFAAPGSGRDSQSDSHADSLGTHIVRGRYRDYRLPGNLRAETYQMRNAALAILALEAFVGEALPPEELWLPALRSEAARMPGRMQRITPRDPHHLPVLLDGAHNPAAAGALKEHLSASIPLDSQAPPSGKRFRIFFSSMRDKDYLEVCGILRSLSEDLVFVDLSGSNPRALSGAELQAVLPDAGFAVRTCTPTWKDLEPLLRTKGESGLYPEIAVFCGSLFLLGAVIPLLIPFYKGLEAFEGLLGEN
jgi:dihydrofolate synthase/folylpolyglutamate synthase